MLASGHPPDDWNQLLDEARTEGDRLQQIAAGVAQVQPCLVSSDLLASNWQITPINPLAINR